MVFDSMSDVEKIYVRVAPYIVHCKEIKSFLETCRFMSADKIVQEIRNKIAKSKAQLKTDLSILLGALETK
ncbi:MAG: hypothetical protein KJ655_03815 [Candidatus Thermoplasmatota archaeon]|nr:hypothetical protein [Candidatus Thermoplasmatota archaeon]